MGNRKIISSISLLLTVFLISGCAMVGKTELSFYQLIYKPGEKIVASYRKTDQKYDCRNNTKVFLHNYSFRPLKVAQGDQLINRIIYASCYRSGIKGSIARRVIHRGEVILRDEAPYEFMSGTWAVTAYIKTPPSAQPGAYTFEMELMPGNQRIKRTFSFQIIRNK